MSNKLCKDCKHFVLSEEWDATSYKEKYSTCALTAVVNGHDGKLCSEVRQGRWFSFCGKSGKKWESK